LLLLWLDLDRLLSLLMWQQLQLRRSTRQLPPEQHQLLQPLLQLWWQSPARLPPCTLKVCPQLLQLHLELQLHLLLQRAELLTSRAPPSHCRRRRRCPSLLVGTMSSLSGLGGTLPIRRHPVHPLLLQVDPLHLPIVIP
jgi:hypothetical protein